MQPAFCKGVGVLPKNTYDNGGDGEVWLPLRKGGPNGLLSVLTLLAWWGQCLTVHTQWEERTDDMWKATVLDVTQCLQKVMDGRRKRICDDDDNRSTKRYASSNSNEIFIDITYIERRLSARLWSDTCTLRSSFSLSWSGPMCRLLSCATRPRVDSFLHHVPAILIHPCAFLYVILSSCLVPLRLSGPISCPLVILLNI